VWGLALNCPCHHFVKNDKTTASALFSLITLLALVKCIDLYAKHRRTLRLLLQIGLLTASTEVLARPTGFESVVVYERGQRPDSGPVDVQAFYGGVAAVDLVGTFHLHESATNALALVKVFTSGDTLSKGSVRWSSEPKLTTKGVKVKLTTGRNRVTVFVDLNIIFKAKDAPQSSRALKLTLSILIPRQRPVSIDRYIQLK
jgi:hypothetical protein